MTNFSISIENIQHVKKLDFNINFDDNNLIVVVGKNGVGKTILFKAIENLKTSNTFAKTSNRYIYNSNSQIKYKIGEELYTFTYNEQVKTLDFKGSINSNILESIYVELSIPFGERFGKFKKLGLADNDIRKAIITKQYIKPIETIKLMNYIYDTDRFSDLKEVKIKNESYYAILLKDDYYIREDYLSSGEYFILNIYKLIQKRCKLIAIDEIDISLDAMAQVRFVKMLREYAQEYKVKLVFSTHSLALMKTLQSSELFYMTIDDGVCTFEQKEYVFIKEQLYGFRDYKKERDELESKISESQMPLIVTEGKTDWKHFKSALQHFKALGKFQNFDVSFLEYEQEMGESQLERLLKEISKVPRSNKILGIFDCDTPLGKKYSLENNQKIADKVYGLAIPIPPSRAYHSGICVEYLYKDEDLKKEDVNGRRLYLSDEFSDHGRLIENSIIVLKNARVIDKKNTKQNSIIIDNDVIDADGRNIALSKNQFATSILNKEEKFSEIDFSGFEELFNMIEKILK